MTWLDGTSTTRTQQEQEQRIDTRVFNVKSSVFGAKGDGGQARTGAITSGSAILTAAAWDSPFKASDVGKNIKVAGAGSAGGVLTTTILSYQSATQVTLAANASTSVSVGGNGLGAVTVWWSQDDSTAIIAAINAARAAGGGTILFPAGIYAASGLTMYDRLHFKGHGPGATVLMQLPASSGDLITGYNYATWTGTTTLSNSSPEGIAEWSISDMTIDGNKDLCPSGASCLKVFTYTHTIKNTHFRFAKSHGVVTEYGLGDTPLMSRRGGPVAKWHQVDIYLCDGKGWQHGGPHDMNVVDVNIYFNAQHGLHTVTPGGDQKNGGLSYLGGHLYGNGGAAGSGFYTVYVETGKGHLFNNVQFEGCQNAQFVALVQTFITSCHFYDGGATAPTGLQIGDATHHPNGINMVNCWFTGFPTTAIDVTNTGGWNRLEGQIYTASGSCITGYTETGNQKLDHYSFTVNGGGSGSLYAYPDTMGTTGQFKVRGTPGIEIGTATGSPRILTCTLTPEGQITAPVGSLAMRTDGGASTTLYVKQSGTGNTGWVAK